jgi:hypothetical protein
VGVEVLGRQGKRGEDKRQLLDATRRPHEFRCGVDDHSSSSRLLVGQSAAACASPVAVSPCRVVSCRCETFRLALMTYFYLFCFFWIIKKIIKGNALFVPALGLGLDDVDTGCIGSQKQAQN